MNNDCKHEHTRPAKWPHDTLECIDCTMLIDPDTMQPLEGAIVDNMKCDHAKAIEDKNTLWE